MLHKLLYMLPRFPPAPKLSCSLPRPMHPTPFSNSKPLILGFKTTFPPWRVNTHNFDLTSTQRGPISLRSCIETPSLQRQAQADRSEVDALQAKLAQYERFLGLMISVGLHQRVLGDAHAAMRAGVDPDQALVDAIKEAAAVPGSPWSTIIPSVTGPRTPDEYRSSLNLTLKTRKELRDAMKIAKFWKRIAHEEGRPAIVTPSVSTLSSIHEPLPAERQKAVEELMASRRRASLASQEGTSELVAAAIPASTSELAVAAITISASSSSASTSSTSADITPSNSGSEFAPCLSPLASESFKTELASRSSNTRIFKRGPSSVSKQTRPPLGQIDMNAASNLVQNSGRHRSKTAGKRKVDSRDENASPQIPKIPNPRTRELSVSNVVPSFSKHSLCSNRLGPLGRIEEEREDFDFVTVDDEGEVGPDLEGGNVSRDLDIGNLSQDDSNWCMLEFPDQDLSLSFCETTVWAAEEAADISTPTKTSRLPKPVLKQLNRMSLNKPGKMEGPRAIAPLAVRKKSAGGPSTTRLPTSTQSRRNVWRT
ncbi:hypothetical protein MVEN_02082900 [Mycena venus]|uniref:Uncharacterized protein n=1 Tax=Mycena venus TaxID=2733690 RepID=A0A8H6XCH2_9AGAR|nr:hypothetical protein MVEN_02082900 [Mycena venus]